MLGSAAVGAVVTAAAVTTVRRLVPLSHPLLSNVLYAGVLTTALGLALTVHEWATGPRGALGPRLVAGAGWPLLAGLAALTLAYLFYAAGGQAGDGTLAGSLGRGRGIRSANMLAFVACALARVSWSVPVGAALGLARLRPAEWRGRGRAAALAGGLGGALGGLCYELVVALLEPGAGRAGLWLLPGSVRPDTVAGALCGAVLGGSIALADVLGPVARLVPRGTEAAPIALFAGTETLGRSDECSVPRPWLPAPLAVSLTWVGSPPGLAFRCEAGTEIAVNGASRSEGSLREGDEVGVAGQAFTVRWNRLRVQAGAPAPRPAPVEAATPADAPGPALVLLAGPRAGERWPLAEGLTVIGSETGCDIRLPDAGVAPRHATVLVHGGQARITDEGEAADLLVDGRRVPTSLLRDGSRVRLGAVELVYLDRDGGRA